MNTQLLDFWGNLLLNMSMGQKQVEKFIKLMNIGSFSEVSKLFGKQGYDDAIIKSISDSLSTSGDMKQKQTEMIDSMLNVGGFEEMSKMFGQFNFNESKSNDSDALKTLEGVSTLLRKMFNQYLEMMGVVSKQDYLELLAKYEVLKNKLSNQTNVMQDLGVFKNGNAVNIGDVAETFETLITKQNEQFQGLMEMSNNYFSEIAKASGKTKSATKKPQSKSSGTKK